MSCGLTLNLDVCKGKSFSKVISWGVAPVVIRPIAGITKGWPTLLDAPSHGLTSDWPFAIVNVEGMTQINARGLPPAAEEYISGRVVDADTVEVLSIDSTKFSSYTSGGQLTYASRPSLAGVTAELQVRKKAGSPLLLRLTSDPDGGIYLDDSTGLVTIYITPEQTAGLSFKVAEYEMEVRTPPSAYAPAGDCYTLIKGIFVAGYEIVTPAI
jgi:hypothetical protein